MSEPGIKALWLSDYFPRPHSKSKGVWALETALALKNSGVELKVLAPTPWIPRFLAMSKTLGDWAGVPDAWEYRGLQVLFPKCLHYPHRYIRKTLYQYFPRLEAALVWHSCKRAIENLFEKEGLPDVVHANFVFPCGWIAHQIKKNY